MSSTDDIMSKLKTLTELSAVYYGCIPAQMKLNKYNYAVVMKAAPKVSGGSWTHRWRIAIVMEEMIPDGYIKDTVAPVLKAAGFKLDTDSIEAPDYVIPANTATKLEANVIYVAKAEKWCP